ncbi:MAG: phosphodiester glycosidase family protein [Armatimonadota bacterium]|nr:phosphodiester glycosidase family protein [Armatimonadota bacterium]MDR7484966.1 phosphodiester glycosidase family protein [Armatimonadota bacterium]MDR7533669.1 phosphodiester glycosidase family protein [Armatimonadota bacterium]MDR7535480.1 phosphodiester glycosidase family protein [Armatimonadota bacterium]
MTTHRASRRPLNVSGLLVGLAVLLCPRPAHAVTPARLLDVQWSSSGPAVYVVTRLAGAVRYRTTTVAGTVVVDLWTVEGQADRVVAVGHGAVDQVMIRRLTPEVIRLEIGLRGPARYRVYTGTDRLTVAVFPPAWSSVPLPQSVAYERLRVPSGARHATVHVVTLDPQALEIRPALGGVVVKATEPTSLAATRLAAVAAINGSYYSHAGLPLGLIVINGRILSAPLERRAVFAVDRAGRPWIGETAFSGRVVTDTGLAVPISAINRPPRWNGLALYTPEFGPLTPPQALLAIVREDRVVSFTRGRPVIPPDGYALAAAESQQAMLQDIRIGQPLLLHLGLSPDGIKHALQGGPRLVRDGRVDIPYAWERFSPAFFRVRTARSAVAITRAGKVLFVTVDRPGHGSAGMDLAGLAALLVRLGARDAMNLDGGGSATLVVGGRVVSALPHGGERTVSSVLVALPRPDEP